MPKINSRGKGAEGEREFARWLQENLKLDFLPTRNLEQVREGGADIMGVKPFVFEVKRCQQLSLRNWWLQVNISIQNMTAEELSEQPIPVVAYRQNHQPWRFLISATHIGLFKGFIQIEEFEARQWMLMQL